MQRVKLSAMTRDAAATSARQVRREGFIPAVLYGRQTAAVSLKLRPHDLSRLLSAAWGKSMLIDLHIEEMGDGNRTVMIKEIQRDPIKGSILHVDLYEVSLEQEIKATVPIALIGEEEVDRAGGILQHGLRELEVECLPTSLPDNVTADVSGLKVGDRITVGDLEVPPGVKVLNSPDEVVASIVSPRVVEEEAEEAEEGEVAGEDAPGAAEEE